MLCIVSYNDEVFLAYISIHFDSDSHNLNDMPIPNDLPSSIITDAIGDQSLYNYTSTYPGTPAFDWNITVSDLLSLDKPTTQQGIYNMRTTYILDDRSYDLELFKIDCITAIESLPFVMKDKTPEVLISTASTKEIETEFEWTYNQTKVEESDIWYPNKVGGNVDFCIKVNNYLVENGDPFYRGIHFLEVKYRIEVDSLTDFNTTMDVFRVESVDGNADGVEFINYEEEIIAFQCRDDFTEITSPPPLTQGDFLNLCVRTRDESKFGVHSIKELDVSQQDDTPTLYSYVDGFIPAPLAETACTYSNTTAATCRAKMQLLSTYFDLDNPADLFANGTVKLDYVGRRLSVDVPLKIQYNNKDDADEGTERRMLAENGGESFGLNVEITSGEESDENIGFSREVLFATAMAFISMLGFA